MTEIWAHRGGTCAHPENSLEAFLEARRMGADGVELDVRRTSDGALVVHHDPEVAGLGPVAELTVRDLPAELALLGTVLRACEDLTLNVEVKHGPGAGSAATVDATEAAVDAVGAVVAAGMSDRVVLSSFSEEVLTAAREAGAGLALGWLVWLVDDVEGVVAHAVEEGYAAVHPWFGAVTPELVAAARSAGLAVRAWPVNEEADLRRMVAWDVDAVITGQVTLARSVVGAGRHPAPA